MKNADIQTDKWLKSNGLNSNTFCDTPLNLAQAQKTAYNLLKHHSELLTVNESQLLKTFLFQLRQKCLIKKVLIANLYRVMNLGTKINREVFKQHQALKKR
jgi:hypothetical protein